MRRTAWIAVVAALLAVTIIADDADARRLGGGRSLGAQRQSVAPPPAASTPHPGAATNPVMPANPSVAPRTAAPTAPAAAPAPARSGMSRWLGPIAGLAAGLGLAALLSHFGLSEGFASFLLLALLVVGVIFLVRMIFMRRSPAPAPYAPSAPRSAWSDSVTRRDERVEPVFGGAREPVSATSRMPPGFDKEAFLRQARMQFKALQQAWDTGDLATIEDVATPEMFAEIKRDFSTPGAQRPTDVVRLDADLLEIATENTQHWASVRFSGLIREDGADAPKLFDETWNLVKPVDGSSGWLLAGIQQNEPAVMH